MDSFTRPAISLYRSRGIRCPTQRRPTQAIRGALQRSEPRPEGGLSREALINQLLRTLTAPLRAAPGRNARKCCPVRRRLNVLRT